MNILQEQMIEMIGLDTILNTSKFEDLSPEAQAILTLWEISRQMKKDLSKPIFYSIRNEMLGDG